MKTKLPILDPGEVTLFDNGVIEITGQEVKLPDGRTSRLAGVLRGRDRLGFCSRSLADFIMAGADVFLEEKR